jgi:hypothetical protein
MSESFPTSTSTAAGQQAALRAGQWRERILTYLREQPATLFEIAAHFNVPDHTISGRFTELDKDGWIERSGERRVKPETGCAADVWRVAGHAATADLGELFGYPLSLNIDGQLHDRQPLLKREGYPGFPYTRRADTGGVRLDIRVELLECPGCGKPLHLVAGRDPKLPKLYRCNATCNTAWRPAIVNEPGKAGTLALIMERF